MKYGKGLARLLGGIYLNGGIPFAVCLDKDGKELPVDVELGNLFLDGPRGFGIFFPSVYEFNEGGKELLDPVIGLLRGERR